MEAICLPPMREPNFTDKFHAPISCQCRQSDLNDLFSGEERLHRIFPDG